MPSSNHRNLVTLTDPRSPAAEAFRTLRTNLTFSSLERPLTTLLVTSAAPEEGKSTTLANLAVTLAQGGRKTIVVDCDLRHPHQHAIFGGPDPARPRAAGQGPVGAYSRAHCRHGADERVSGPPAEELLSTILLEPFVQGPRYP